MAISPADVVGWWQLRLPRTDLNFLTLSRGLRRSKNVARERPAPDLPQLRAASELPAPATASAVKKVPPKVAPKPRRFVTDILISDSQQYLSLDCLTSSSRYGYNNILRSKYKKMLSPIHMLQ